jgi:hypothetical protein
VVIAQQVVCQKTRGFVDSSMENRRMPALRGFGAKFCRSDARRMSLDVIFVLANDTFGPFRQFPNAVRRRTRILSQAPGFRAADPAYGRRRP